MTEFVFEYTGNNTFVIQEKSALSGITNPLIYLHLIFKKSSLKTQVGWTLIFTVCVAFKFEIDKKPNLSI